MKVLILRAMLSRADILLLDEVTKLSTPPCVSTVCYLFIHRIHHLSSTVSPPLPSPFLSSIDITSAFTIFILLILTSHS